LVESAMLAVLGCALGLLLGAWTRELLVSTAPMNIPRLDTAALSWRVLGFTGLLATLTTFLFGMIPAWQVSGIRPNVVGSLQREIRGWAPDVAVPQKQERGDPGGNTFNHAPDAYLR
jgi:predicted lysophospholipase L1 biosynthesis ABC-type transport system permease subunit